VIDEVTTYRDGEEPPLPAEQLTWAALLGRWVEFARSALALPADEAGQRLRQSVPDLIMLQAVWFALQHLDDLQPAERALGLDRAQILVDKHTAALRERWAGTDMPIAMTELIRDAREQLARVMNGLSS
jgi:hypothetical protein